MQSPKTIIRIYMYKWNRSIVPLKFPRESLYKTCIRHNLLNDLSKLCWSVFAALYIYTFNFSYFAFPKYDFLEGRYRCSLLRRITFTVFYLLKCYNSHESRWTESKRNLLETLFHWLNPQLNNCFRSHIKSLWTKDLCYNDKMLS